MEYRRRLPLAPVGWAVIALDARAACAAHAAHAAHATRRPPPPTRRPHLIVVTATDPITG